MSTLKFKNPETGEWEKIGLPPGGEIDAYTKDEIDSFLTGKAPAGYGLGENVAVAPTDDNGYSNAGLIASTGFYRAMEDTAFSGWNYILHIQYSDTAAKQLAFDVNSECIAFRTKYASTYSEWFGINPLMNTDTEYLTMDCVEGKPVYKKYANGVVQYRLDGETEWKPYATLTGAAPTGYGLGENAPVIKTTSPLGIGRTGWFRTNDDLMSLGLTPGWWFGQHIAYGDNEGVWELNHYLDGLKAVIRIVNGVMQPAEWENPPTQPNVEYRTTERFLGKPVYVKLVDFGPMPNNTRKLFDHSIADISTSLSVLLISTSSGLDLTNDLNVTECRGTRTQIVVSTNTDMSSYSARALFKYTKTTD